MAVGHCPQTPATPCWCRCSRPLCLAAALGLLVVVFGIPHPVAAAAGHESRVRASSEISQPSVGPPQHVSADQHRGSVLLEREIVVASGVAGGGGRSKAKTPGQMNAAIKRNQAPAGVKRVDTGKIPGEQTHVHLLTGQRSTWTAPGSMEGLRSQTKQKTWLKDNGWSLPGE